MAPHLWSTLNAESIQELADTSYQLVLIHTAEEGLINLIHIGQFFAFKLYLWPISRSICILIFFCFRTGSKPHSRGPDFTIINRYYQPLSFPKHQQFLKIRLSCLSWVLSSCLSLGSVVSFNQAQSLQPANIENEKICPEILQWFTRYLASLAAAHRSQEVVWPLPCGRSQVLPRPQAGLPKSRGLRLFLSLF